MSDEECDDEVNVMLAVPGSVCHASWLFVFRCVDLSMGA